MNILDILRLYPFARVINTAVSAQVCTHSCGSNVLEVHFLWNCLGYPWKPFRSTDIETLPPKPSEVIYIFLLKLS